MHLNNISLENFRNYKQISVDTSSDLVLILGENASGKTNFLESIYFLSRLKSFRAPDNLLVKYQEDFFSIIADLNVAEDFSLPNGGLPARHATQGVAGGKTSATDIQKLEVIVQTIPALKRQFKINQQKTKRGLWQSFTTVLFVPNDLNMFHLGPLLRRRFLDEALSQTDSAYNLDLESLDHILKQKSALLEQIFQNQAQASQLDVWNQELAPVATRITQKRQGLIDFFNARLSDKINQLTDFNNQFNLQYKRIFAKTEAELLDSLKSHEQTEIRSGQNLIGPHRDDFELQKDEQTNLFNSSRGELRAQILALKLLQAEFLDQSNKKPIILLDDVFSELDETRRTRLIENLKGHQIFITSTEEHHLPKLAKDALILKVENNEIK